MHKCITNRVLRIFDSFYGLLQLYEQKCHKTHISASFVAQVSQIVFLADLTVLQLIRTVWVKNLQNSYLREFCAQVSKIVYLAHLTVLQPYYYFMKQKCYRDSYLREFCAQVSEIVFQADLTVLRLITTVWAKMSPKLISPRVLCTSIKNRVPSWFDRSTAYYNCVSTKMSQKSYLREF